MTASLTLRVVIKVSYPGLIAVMDHYPHLFRVRQHLEAPRVDDVASEVERQLALLALERSIRPGQSVAITVESSIASA